MSRSKHVDELPDSPPPAYSYDQDARDVDDVAELLSSDADTDDESREKTPGELARADQAFLDDEEEQERLLMQGERGGDSSSFLSRLADRRNARKQRRGERKARKRDGQETKELIYDTEQGGRGSISSGSDASQEEFDKLRGGVAEKKISSRHSKRLRAVIYVFIALFFLVIAFGAWRASKSLSVPPKTDDLLSNGTSLFAKTTILISLDGFRADYLQRGITPELNKFVREGVSPLWMNPSFPSVTFPNHYTLVTGLYPESHGIVGNSFYDPHFEEMFYYTDPEHSMQSKWWSNEPLWVTAEEQGVRTAIHMWPGSEAHIGGREPTYVDKFNGTEVLKRKSERIMELLDKPGPWDQGASREEPRPQLIAAYVPDVDADGHKFGPNSTEIDETIARADAFIKDVMDGLEARNLRDIVNVVVVSDHGMATTSTHKVYQLEDLLDVSLISEIDGWPHYGLRLKDPDKLQSVYDALSTKAKDLEIDVYLRDVDMPARFHFSRNERIAPLWIMPRTGWAIATFDDFNVAAAIGNHDDYHPRGIHGYDHEHPLMRSIFVARGPAFAHAPGSRVAEFQNVEVYNILCDSIGVQPMPNNGTLRLPLQTIGLHEGEHPSMVEDHSGNISTEPDADQGDDQPADEPQEGGDAEEGKDDKDALHDLWRWLQVESGELKEWVKQLVEGAKAQGDADIAEPGDAPPGDTSPGDAPPDQ